VSGAAETRRETTREEIERSFQPDKYGDWYADRFALWDNPRFAALSRLTLTEIEERVTPAQIMLFAICNLSGEVANGGLEQCFFNYEQDRHVLRAAVQAFGWGELTRRFEEKYAVAFEAANTKGFLQTMRAAEHQGGDTGTPDAQPFSHFAKIYDVLDFDDFNHWLCYDGRDELQARLRAFIVANETGLFVIADR
jgi:hypothetical protein